MAKTKFEDLPYRACVGMMVLNKDGLAFIGRRLGGPEHTDDDHVWQMPQGGVDEGEDLYEAALRELAEETSIHSVTKIGEIDDWLTYDLPSQVAKEAWKGKYRGQKQKWYAFRFTGNEKEINILEPVGGHKPEFVEWRWEPIRNLPSMLIPFKRPVYDRVVKEFSKFAK